MKVEVLIRQKTTDNYAVSASDRLTDAAKIMSEQRIGSLVILDNERPVSIVTERDVMLAVSKYGNQLETVTVADVMAPKLVTCDAETDLDDAMALLIQNETGQRIRHLPVLKEGAFIGVISIGDVVEALLTKTEFENKLLRNYIKNWPDEE